jgi:hypothetical protein
MRLFCILFISIFCSMNLNGQSIVNVDFISNDDYVKVTYDLINGTEGKSYNINVLFEKRDGTMITPQTLSGDYSKVVPGYNKQIIWDYKTDVDEYIGEIRVVLSISETNDLLPNNNADMGVGGDKTQKLNYDGSRYVYSSRIPRALGGPDNAILSALLPGFGDHFVNEKDRVTPYFVTAAFLASGYMAYSTMVQANDYYEKYQNARTQVEMDAMYTKATEYRSQHQIFFGVASAIWLFDVIHVASKGSKNMRKTSGKQKSVKLLPMYNQFKKSNPFEFTLVKTF